MAASNVTMRSTDTTTGLELSSRVGDKKSSLWDLFDAIVSPTSPRESVSEYALVGRVQSIKNTESWLGQLLIACGILRDPQGGGVFKTDRQ